MFNHTVDDYARSSAAALQQVTQASRVTPFGLDAVKKGGRGGII